MQAARQYLDEGGHVAILDATNASHERRDMLEEQLRDDYTDCYGGVVMMAVDCVTCQLRDDCGRSRVLKALAKWRGEAGE